MEILCVTLAVLDLAVRTRLILNWEIHLPLLPLSTRIKGVCHHAWLTCSFSESTVMWRTQHLSGGDLLSLNLGGAEIFAELVRSEGKPGTFDTNHYRKWTWCPI